MTEEKDKPDDVIHIDTGGPENTLRAFEEEYKTLPPQAKKYALKYILQSHELFWYKLRESLERLRDLLPVKLSPSEKRRLVIDTFEEMQRRNESEFIDGDEHRIHKVTAQDVFDEIGAKVGIGKRRIEQILKEHGRK